MSPTVTIPLVTLTVNDGHATATDTVNITVHDTTPPKTTITSGPPVVTNNSSATFTFVSNETGTFQCQLDAGSFAACASPKSYTGLTMASNASGTFLYAANALPSPAHPNGTIDVFDQHFTPTRLQGSFTDANLPASYTVYNIQTVAGFLLVTYALPPTSPSQVGDGFVDVFDTNGHLIRRLISRGPLDAPWGLVLAPAQFGRFSKALLVGNLANGYINAFNFETGAFRGTLKNRQGQPIQNAGLWALTFGNGSQGFNPDTLYFDAGIDNFQHGLFGAIRPGS